MLIDCSLVYWHFLNAYCITPCLILANIKVKTHYADGSFHNFVCFTFWRINTDKLPQQVPESTQIRCKSRAARRMLEQNWQRSLEFSGMLPFNSSHRMSQDYFYGTHLSNISVVPSLIVGIDLSWCVTQRTQPLRSSITSSQSTVRAQLQRQLFARLLIRVHASNCLVHV